MGNTGSKAGRCQDPNSSAVCGIEWDKNNIVTKLGRYERGKFQANPSIAGNGVLAAFGTFSVLIGIGCVLYFVMFLDKWRKVGPAVRNHPKGGWQYIELLQTRSKELDDSEQKLPKAGRAFLLATSDGQTFLTIAYGVAFLKSGKCDLSAYHLAIAINITLITCANFALSNLMIRRYWAHPLSALIRYGSISIVVVALGWLTNYERSGEYPEWQPPSTRNSSAILLPASCFMDPDHQVFNISDTRLDTIGHPIKIAWGFVIWILITILLGIGAVKNLLGPCVNWHIREKNQQNYSRIWSSAIAVYKGLILALCLTVHVYSWVHIIQLKNWVRKSGWIDSEQNGNPEDTWDSIGQITPIFALATHFFTLSDIVTWRCLGTWFCCCFSNKKRGSKNSYPLT